MKDTDETAFLNSLFMDFTIENELELFLKSLYEVWSENLYSRLYSSRFDKTRYLKSME